MENNLKLIELKSQNIFGMTTDIKFKSNMVVIYSYNRTGKTLIVKIIKHAFSGFRKARNKYDYSKIIGANPNGSIIIVFSYKGSVFRIVRRLTQKEESVHFQKYIGNTEDFSNLPTVKKRTVWNSSKSEDLLPLTKIKNNNLSVMQDKLSELKLFSNIIDRLIAIENNQEFQNATVDLARGEGGYHTIKELLFKELKIKDDALEEVLNASERQLQYLNKHNLKIQNGFKSLIIELEEVIEIESIENKDDKQIFQNIINQLVLDEDYTQNLTDVDEIIDEQSDGCNDELDAANETLTSLNGKISIYSDLEKYLNHLPLKQIVSAIELFIDSKGLIKSKYQDLNSLYRDIENIRKFEPIKNISVNFPNLSKSEDEEENPLIDILEENSLKIPENAELLSGVTSEINGFIEIFNNAGTQYSKFNSMLDQFQVKPENLSDHIKKYEDQLERIQNPVKFSKKDTIYPLFGRIEKIPNGKNILKIFMPINDLNSYFESKNPIELDNFITPMANEGEVDISEDVIKSLTDQIKKYIKDFKKMQEIQESLPEIIVSLNESMSEFESINESLDNSSSDFLDWNSFISKNITLAVNFINTHFEEFTKSKNFDSLHRTLVKFQEKEITHISTIIEGYNESNDETQNRSYNETKTLNENLDRCIAKVNKFIKYITEFLEKIARVKDFILIKNQARYKTLCENFVLNRTIKDKIIPIMATICSRIKKNINVDNIEKKVMDSIIKYSQTFYHYITKEDFLILKKIEVDDKIYLKPYMKKPGGEDQVLLDDAPSGSEQAAFSLGIMVALAKIFNAFVVIDEVANRFDHPTEMRFFDAIKQYSEDLFMIIVLWVKVREDQVEHEFNNIRDSFPNADIFQPIKIGMTSTVKRLQTFEDFMPRGE